MALALQKIESIFLFEGQKQIFLYKILLPSAYRVFLFVKLFFSQNLISYPSNWPNLNNSKGKITVVNTWKISHHLLPTLDVCLGLCPNFTCMSFGRRMKGGSHAILPPLGSVFSPDVNPFLGAFISQTVHLKGKKDLFLFGCKALYGPSFFW